MINQDCTRSLLMYLDDQLRIPASGKHPKPVKLKKALSDDSPRENPLRDYPKEDVYASARFLVEKRFVEIVAIDPNRVLDIAPRAYVFRSVTAKGSEYLEKIKSPKAWSFLKKRFGNVFEATLPQLIASLAGQLF